jgi:hypothetical protein
MDIRESPTTSTSSLPQGYRQGLVTAITLFLGFSLAFTRFWAIENPGDWSWHGALAALIIGAGAVVQLYALWRSLELRDDEPTRYTHSVRWFFAGVLIVVLGVVDAIFVAAT